MIPHPANHVCLRCETAWHERGDRGTCWSCHQTAQPGTVTDLFKTTGRSRSNDVHNARGGAA